MSAPLTINSPYPDSPVVILSEDSSLRIKRKEEPQSKSLP